MAKKPRDRFQLAADAALSLLELPDEIPLVDGSGNQVGVWHEGEETIVAPPVFVPVTDTAWATEPVVVGRPGLPSSWAQPSSTKPAAPLPGLGRSLFNLATAPFCGRVEERDTLWAALKTSIDHQKVQVALIQGESGVGKTILSSWIGRRAHEVGAALPALVTHQNPNGEQCGLRGLVHRIFKCEHLDIDERSERIAAQAEGLDLSRYADVYDSISAV